MTAALLARPAENAEISTFSGAGTAMLLASPEPPPLPVIRPGCVWPDARVDQLKSLWKAGASHSIIADIMGLDKGAVSGKCARLGLYRPKPVMDGRSLVERTYAPPAEPDVPGVTLMERTGCAWPIRETPEGDHLFCDTRKVAGKPYCLHHMARAYPNWRPK